VVLVLDEFQEIVTLDPELPARMRATFQLSLAMRMYKPVAG
jgi:hypothetical protein